MVGVNTTFISAANKKGCTRTAIECKNCPLSNTRYTTTILRFKSFIDLTGIGIFYQLIWITYFEDNTQNSKIDLTKLFVLNTYPKCLANGSELPIDVLRIHI